MRARGTVTTGARPTPATLARAAVVASRCGWPWVPRRGPPDGLAYVVGRQAEWLVEGEARLGVDVGLLHARLAEPAHPLIRAVGPAARVLDGTLGLAVDALHLAGALGAEVVAAERSPAVFSLAEAGLGALGEGRWAEVAGRIRPVWGAAAEVAVAEGPFDAVFFAPMFAARGSGEPARAAPGYALFRQVAAHGALDPGTLAAARRVAPRVVVRVNKGEPPPEPAGWTPVLGRRVDYWCWTR